MAWGILRVLGDFGPEPDYRAVFSLNVRDRLHGSILTQDIIQEVRGLWTAREQWGAGMDEALDKIMGTRVNVDSARLYEVRVFMARPWRGRECNIDEICMYAAARDIDPETLMRMAYWMKEFQNPLMEFVVKG